MSVTVAEDVSVKIQNYALSVNDSSSLTESIGRKLICNIKPVTGGTFGNTNKEATSERTGANVIFACKYTSGGAGTLESIKIYIKQYSTDTPKIKCAIFDSSFNLLTNGTTEEKTVGSGQDGWMEFAFSTSPTVAASTIYYLAWWTDGDYTHYYTTGASSQTPYDILTYDGWPDPLEPGWYHSRKDSIQAVYTTGGPVESVSVAESIARKLISFINVNDAASVTDVDAVQLLTLFNLSVHDDVSLSELIANALKTKISVYDSTALTELISSSMALAGIDVSDTVSVAEYIKAMRVFLISKYETVTVAEAVAMLRVMPGISVSDAVALAEKIVGNMWKKRTKETDIWTERTKETDAWTERTKETDTWTERPHKEGA